MAQDPTFTAFLNGERLAHGTAAELAAALTRMASDAAPPLILADESGRQTDLDLRGGPDEIRQRYAPEKLATEPKPGRGRPKLGVVPREVTLLPRHWEWLSSQPGGASAAIRRLVDQARRDLGDAGAQRERREAAYRAMSALAGDAPGFEEASRALFAGDRTRLQTEMAPWPADVRDYILGQLDRSPPLD